MNHNTAQKHIYDLLLGKCEDFHPKTSPHRAPNSSNKKTSPHRAPNSSSKKSYQKVTPHSKRSLGKHSQSHATLSPFTPGEYQAGSQTFYNDGLIYGTGHKKQAIPTPERLTGYDSDISDQPEMKIRKIYGEMNLDSPSKYSKNRHSAGESNLENNSPRKKVQKSDGYLMFDLVLNSKKENLRLEVNVLQTKEYPVDAKLISFIENLDEEGLQLTNLLMLVSNKFCEKNRVIRELRAELESRPIFAPPPPEPINPEDQVDARLLAEALKKIERLEGLLSVQGTDLDKKRSGWEKTTSDLKKTNSDLDKARSGWEKTTSDLKKTTSDLDKAMSDLEKTERKLQLKEEQNKTLNDGLQGKNLEIQELEKELGGLERDLEAEVLEQEESNAKKDVIIQELRAIIAARENANRSLQADIAKLKAQIEAHLGKLG